MSQRLDFHSVNISFLMLFYVSGLKLMIRSIAVDKCKNFKCALWFVTQQTYQGWYRGSYKYTRTNLLSLYKLIC
jgi:hypothetical protein